MDYGYIKISRKMFIDDPFWDERRQFSRAEAWIDLIQLASWRDRQQIVGATVVSLKRGELLASERFLSERWQWSRSKVRRFLDALVKMERIRKTDHEADHLGCIVSICNYDIYQANPEPNGPATDHERTTSGPATDHERTGNGPRADQRECSKEVNIIAGSYEPDGSLTEQERKASFCRAAAPLIREHWWQGNSPPPGTHDRKPWTLGREINLAWSWVEEGTADEATVLAFLERGRLLLRMRDGPASIKWLNKRVHRHRLYEVLDEVRKSLSKNGTTSLSDLLKGVGNAA